VDRRAETIPDYRPRYRGVEVEFNPFREMDESGVSSHTYDYNPFE